LLIDADTWAKCLRDARNALGHWSTDEPKAPVPEDAQCCLEYVSRGIAAPDHSR